MSSAYFFFVAEASAISSAPKTTSRGTFFSRASTSTSITSSLFPAARFAATMTSQFRYQMRPVHVPERQGDRAALDLHAHLARLGAAQHAGELAPAARVGGAHAHFRPLPGEPGEVGLLAQGPIEPRRGDLEPLVVDPLDGQHPLELPRQGGAIVEVDAPRLVDEHAQQAPAVRLLHVDQLEPHAGHYRLQLCFNACHQSGRLRGPTRSQASETKNGPKPICREPEPTFRDAAKAFEV